jgi:CheY-like chemotaxis protein
MPQHRILAVDDSKVVHELVRYALETVAGWEVVSATSGAAALALDRAEPFDAILLDVEMPDMDGPATAAALHARDPSPGTPIVFLTAHDDPAEQARLLTSGVMGLVAKPFDAARLADQLSALLGWAR